MNVIAIIISIVALTNKRMQYIFKLFLSGITAYYVYKLQYPNTILYDFKDYDKAIIEKWISSGACWRALIYTSLCWLFFYVLLRVALSVLIVKPLSKRFADKFPTLGRNNERRIKVLMIKLLRKNMRIFYKIFKYTGRTVRTNQTNIIESVYSFFSIVLHVICCWFILGINNTIPIYILAVTIVIILFIPVLSMSIIKPFFDSIYYIIEHEEYLIEHSI